MRSLLSAALLWGCVSTMIEAEMPVDVRIIASSDVLVADAGPDLAVDAAPDPDRGLGPLQDAAPPGPPYVPGPPAETYDCSGAVPPGRRSPVPLDCPLRPGCREPMVVGHRGAGGALGAIAPENSLAAIRAALVMGLDGVELDVRHTADDGLVLMHDVTVDRTTFGTGRVDASSTAELTALALRPPIHPRAAGDFDCERVPSLGEALALTRGRLIVLLDVETDRTELVVAAIAQAGVRDEVFFNTGSISQAVEAREADPALRVMVRVGDGAEYDEAMARFDSAPEVVQIPSGRVVELAGRTRARGQSLLVEASGEDAVALVRGGDVYLELFEAGADIIQSEFPPLVIEALQR